MTTFWLAFLDWFASISALVAVGLTLTQLQGNRTYHAVVHYLSQCDVAMANPQFSNPELGKLDLRAKTFDGKATEFERYEWYVARLVYVLDAAMRQAPFQQWRAVAKTQLANHQHYFASDYYAKQDYLKHYSRRMRKLITQQRAA
jgi:hypothetical protein